ncbi:fumarylacetoacetate hydrolase family protein [Legionella oakridgensis]|uniref:2-keto-4-pentenoate hydratase/2-oxohepta-3-ene-1,7-dioic acid hydratase catechol pathway n=2 Tax=Legionella oakridgensis TaxID=29423 RepID=W0BA25_9GAMM|nr:fumarylacetoacetate hydrolase family protein [Legionella oakridgensis]AHE67378.1 2-keto-4-pentenoate hydratase/2-oxohepta-3-ene-1,7-dioic acid hydratase catechol pathway [Legionella oakridgensis ATCC 33761 = DSM 21215]ETO93038.1 2-keto-4-pentenoate hydratase/2-oxohepta-3-ene-1,7-dioic acid hydratase (catechol pathway) [Legionella oakridgensis RV-2-2007]KTD43446.1 fumarylacetoacetate hydrolase [Legionella oakridgensis]STY20437.1 fumarylacetoacetate hydrolase [Legionella longbeachae]
MKLATLKSGKSRDGELCVVNKSLTKAICVSHIVPTLQAAIENWTHTKKKLEEIYQQLNEDSLKETFAFDSHALASPLPRAYQWADGSAYVNHVELVRKARGAEMPANFWTDPLMYQGGSDGFLAPNDPIVVTDEAYGVDFEAEVAIITEDVKMGIDATSAEQHICLLMLVNDVSLRNLIPNEIAKGFGFFQSKPASSFSPVAVTPEELGSYWDGKRLHLPLYSYLNGKLFGQPNAGIDMTFSFPELIAHAAKTRTLSAGTIIGSGTVSNLDRSKGSSCIAEKRMLEILATGKPNTPFMHFGDTIRIEMHDEQGQSIFGAIEQQVCSVNNHTAHHKVKDHREII